jgi:phosphohistidine phosphatase
MDILIVRHAIAEDREQFARRGLDDGLRPLTRKGIERMREGARGLKQVVEQLDALAASPLSRAQQTAEILVEAFAPGPVLEVPELAPGHGPAAVTAWLAAQETVGTLALVGHEPDLSELVAWLVCGRSEGFLDLKKGAACLISAHGRPAQGGCILRWALTPRQLRRLGRR